MGQLLFQYVFNPILETVNQFQYHWEKTTEYGLYYQRYAALSDASIFDAPVAITKVATGVSRIHELFPVDKVVHPAVYLNSLFIEKSQKDTEEITHIAMQPKYDKEASHYIGLNSLRRTIIPNKDAFDGVFVYAKHSDGDSDYFFDEDYKQWALRINHMSICRDEFLRRKTWMHGEYFGELRRLEREWNLRLIPGYETLSLPQEWKDLNLYDIVFGKLPTKIFSVREDFFIWTHGPIGNIYYTDAVKRLDDDHMNIYQIQYNLKRTEPGWSVFPQEFMKFRDRTGFNIYENIYGTPDRKDICLESFQRFGQINTKAPKWLENVFGSKKDPSINWYENVSGSLSDKHLNQFQSITGKPERKEINIIASGESVSRQTHWSLWEQIYCHRNNSLYGNVFDFYSMTSQNSVLNAFQTLLGKADKRYGYLQNVVSTPSKQREEGFLDYHVGHGFKSHLIGSAETYVISGKKNIDSNSVEVGRSAWGLKTIQSVFELTLNDFCIREKKTVFTINGVQGINIDKIIDIGDYVFVYRTNKSVMMNWTMKTNSIAMGKLVDKNWDVLEADWARKEEHDIWLDDYFQLGGILSNNNIGGKSIWIENDVFGKKSIPDMVLMNEVWTSSPIKHLDFDIGSNLLGSVERKALTAFNDFGLVFGNKGYSHIGIWDNVLAYKVPGDFEIKDTFTAVDKSRHEFSIKDTSTQVIKIPKDFLIEDSLTSVYKIKKDLYFEMVYLWFAYKVPKDFVIMPWEVFPNKVKKDMTIQDLSISGIKDRKGIPDTDTILSAIKSAFSFVVTTGTHPPKWEEIGGFIVPISKVRKGTMDREIDEMAKKRFKDAMLNEGVFASVIAQDLKSMLNSNLVSLDKLPYHVFLDYQNDWIIKSRIHGAIHDDYVVGIKLEHEGVLEDGVWTSKGQKLLQVQPQEWLKKLGKSSSLSGIDDIWLHQEIRQLSVFAVESLKKTQFNTSIFDQVVGSQKEIAVGSVFQEYWLEKLPNLCYYSYGEWLKKDIQQSIVYEDEFASKTEGKAILNLSSPVIRKNLKAWYDDYIVGESIIREGELAAQLEWLEKTRRKCGLHPNDFGNWAWVYETPDPFQYSFGIDELLLPENDTHYENFKELIFDSHYMRPRKPVKEISNTQWIAKYPVKHPTPKWSDIAIDYDASAIDWQNYYGIETSIMHDMFLRYYRIWQVKMFEFSTMTMQQSVNLMLEYLWAWIPEYYPVNKLEEAYRVFKLIRWFGEAAIINNSQYIISYEYDNGGMKMKEDTKTHKKVWNIYGIDVDLKDCNPSSTNDSMFLDRKQFVIRNNPVYIGVGPAYVEFTFIAKRNTTVNFTLMNTIGSVNIYVDGELVDVRSKTSKVIIPIQYTGDEVVIRIEKDKNNNLNNQFMIGNLSIPEQDFKDLTIEFDPQLRAGNKPLNEIAQKLVAYAMLHDQRDTAWSEALKANLGVSEVYKKMTQYWEDHHAGKIKGKRLTIKQV